MRKINVFVIASIFAFSFFTVNANAIDKKQYLAIAESTIVQLQKKPLSDMSALIKQQEQLMAIGIQGALDYIAKHHDKAAILGEVIANANKMKLMTLTEIEAQWHHGGYMKSRGYDMQRFEHFGSLYGLMDSIIHPATCYIHLKNYQRKNAPESLDRCVGELIEVMEHVRHIGKS